MPLYLIVVLCPVRRMVKTQEPKTSYVGDIIHVLKLQGAR